MKLSNQQLVISTESSVTPQRVAPSNPTTNNLQHHYEVTESNEVNSLQPNYFAPDFDPTQYAASIIQEQQVCKISILIRNLIFRTHTFS